ncbi:4209_t:CDS:2 [Funneliformis geosporum]|uniref:7391_t:CDS:1 n=1 Tax=Funneliformis geosporum TaxID=1117311 RepID=A0A9W4WK12_9GLOM|nr:7391_t:CDS:2 [Funneliformis geosporum]CAI2174870.1 4209_t:CDS:2 [Funneliformis geosporum]
MEPLASTPNKQTIVSSTSKLNKRSVTILPPTQVTTIDKKTKKTFILEYSVHLASNRFNRELKCVFPQVENFEKCLVIPTFLKCEHDLVGIGAAIDLEKDEKLEVFVEWGKEICHKLRNRGYWADLTDPCSGYPVFSEPGPAIYPDVQGAVELLKYDLHNAGCCHILLHPKWGSKVYPGTLFTTANDLVLKQVISECIVI